MVIIFVAILLATFCLPKISSFAYFISEEEDLFLKVQKYVQFNHKPKITKMKLYVTAYSSTREQTDDTPCIAASGYDLCAHNKENVVACNFLPLGTKVKIPQFDPDTIYTVVDRMHERFNSRVDIWMTSSAKAHQFGLKYLTVEIYE